MLKMEMQRIIVKLAEMQEKADTNGKEMKSNEERIDANLNDLTEDIKYGQAKIRSIFEAIEKKIASWIANSWDHRKERTEARLECEAPNSGDKRRQPATMRPGPIRRRLSPIQE
jgi:hypothetical protein